MFTFQLQIYANVEEKLQKLFLQISHIRSSFQSILIHSFSQLLQLR